MLQHHDEGFIERYYRAADGLQLYARVYGAENRDLSVVCLPGLTRNSRDFHGIALALSQDPANPRQVVTLDYRGRGRSDWDDEKSRYNFLVEAQDVIAACEALAIGRAAFIGTSRGGITLHLLAGMRPELLAGVILNDIGPVIDIEGLRQIQAYLGGDRRLPKNFEEAASMLKRIHGGSFTALSDDDWLDMAHAIYREIDGEIRSDFDPAIAEQICALDLSQPAVDLWPQFDQFAEIPLMTIRGENSSLLSAETLEAMTIRHPGMTALTVSGQGHAPIPHLGGIAEAIGQFLRRLG